MEEAAEALVLAPFKEIVEKAKTAVVNAKAGDSQEADAMLKAANNLVREGQRAVKKIELPFKRLFETCGQNFIDALKENDEIAGYRTTLNDLLWEFDDYTELDEFDSDKFSELQAISRNCAPKIVEVLKRLKLEPAEQAIPATPIALATPASVSVSPATFPAALAQTMPQSEPEVVASSSVSVLSTRMMGAQSGPDLGLEGGIAHQNVPSSDADAQGQGQGQAPSRNESTRSKASSPVAEEPPPFPEKSPWRAGAYVQSPTASGGNSGDEPKEEDLDVQRRPRIPTPPPAPETLPTESVIHPAFRGPIQMQQIPLQQTLSQHIQLHNHQSPDGRINFPSLPSPVNPVQGFALAAAGQNDADQRSWSGSKAPAQPLKAQSQKDAANKTLSQAWTYIPMFSGSHGGTEDPANGHTQTQLRAELKKDAVRHSGASSAADSRHSSVSEPRRDSGYEQLGPAATTHRSSVMSIPEGAEHYTHPPQHGNLAPILNPITERGPPVAAAPSNTQMYQPSLEALGEPPMEVDSGLIPVETEVAESQPKPYVPLPVREPDCLIGPSSSFHLLKGFCEGAKEIMRGGAGFKQVRKLSYGTGAIMAAKCRNCLFELEWREVEADRNGEASANYMSKSSNIGFRIRFLSKSHLPARTIDDQVYACLFCIQLGRTNEESDATVFFSQKQLFAHIARHAQPLPIVPGLNVIEGDEIPAVFRNNYDLYFPHPPKPSVTKNLTREIEMLPMATAVETVKQTHGTLRLPPDRGPPLQFAVGAKIVGVEFPKRYNGEWAIGWNDNTRAVFPADAIKLEPPPKAQIAVQGATNLRAIVRWKFSVKDKDRGDWLKLDKGDVISNIAWIYPGHWCWSGTNSKGKWGIFPQSHIDSNTLREGTSVADRASISSHERKMSSLFTRMSVRPRPGSSAGNYDITSRPSIY